VRSGIYPALKWGKIIVEFPHFFSAVYTKNNFNTTALFTILKNISI
jgi:hypothetical protein